MIGVPLSAGVANVTTICALPGAIVGWAGALGSPSSTDAEGVEAGPVPTPLVAVTVQVYVWPLVSPATVIGVAAAPRLELPSEVVPSVHVAV